MAGIVGAFPLSEEGRKTITDRTYNMQVFNQNRGEKRAAMVVASDTKASFDIFSGEGFVHDALGNNLKHLRSKEPLTSLGYNMKSKLVGHEPHTVSGKKYKVSGAMSGYLLDSKKPLNKTISNSFLKHLEETKDFEEAGERFIDENYGRGPYCAVFLVNDGQETSQIAIRDQFGMKPLNLAANEDIALLSSETVGFQKAKGLGEKFDVYRPLEPGEMVILNSSTTLKDLARPNIIRKNNKRFLDFFEFFYTSNKISVFDGVYVGDFRKHVGEVLTELYPEIIEIDEYTFSPDSGLGVTKGSPRRSKEFLIKIPGSKRIYQLEDKEEREYLADLKWQVDEKLIMKAVMEYGRDISIGVYDDSIVRGNNCIKMNNLFRGVQGVGKIFYIISAPPLKFPFIEKVESFDRQKYAAEGMLDLDVREIGQKVAGKTGSDGIFYPDLETVIDVLGRKDVCTDCFNGEYPVLSKYLEKYDSEMPKGYISLLD